MHRRVIISVEVHFTVKENKESTFNKVLKKVEGKGFYIILGLCVLAIGVSGYVLFFTDTVEDIPIDSTIDIDSVFDPDTGDSPVVNAPDEDNQTDNTGTFPGTTFDPDITNDPTMSDPNDQPVVQLPNAVAPTAGDVIREFSGDQLVYDITMEDWRTHNGTDYSCTQGDTIFCVRDGTVTDVFEDGLMGWSVSVKHADGIISTYSGLSSVAVVKKGDTLKMGDAVGTAGGTAIAESNQPYHIHVSITKDGKYIDLKSLF